MAFVEVLVLEDDLEEVMRVVAEVALVLLVAALLLEDEVLLVLDEETLLVLEEEALLVLEEEALLVLEDEAALEADDTATEAPSGPVYSALVQLLDPLQLL